MKAMHEQTARLYEAARAAKRLSGDADQAELAALLNVAPQNVNNWDKRGPSRDALLAAQAAFGVNATWVLTGVGSMFIGGGPTADIRWPFTRVDAQRVWRLSPEERAFVEAKLESALEAAELRIAAEKSRAAA